MSDAPAKVRMTHPDGSVDEAVLAPDDYMVLTGPQRYIDGIQQYGNGTVVVTIKREREETQ